MPHYEAGLPAESGKKAGKRPTALHLAEKAPPPAGKSAAGNGEKCCRYPEKGLRVLTFFAFRVKKSTFCFQNKKQVLIFAPANPT